MALSPDDTTSALEQARERLYSPRAVEQQVRRAISASGAASVPHAWGAKLAPKAHPHIRLALVFFLAAVAFAVVAGVIAFLILFTGSTSVSTDNITLQTQGPTTIAAGDTVPLSLAITNKNVVALENATLEVDFPPGTVSATDQSQAYPRYTENLGTIAPGATVLRSVKAVVFGSAGTSLNLPISLSYEASGSNATFVKKVSYPLTVTSAPLSVSVEAPSETVSGQPLSLVATVRSNATTPLKNVVLAAQLPFGFTVKSSSIPIQNSSFLVGTLAPGASQTVTITGVMTGQSGDQKDFHFTIGTGSSPTDTNAALAYMSQDVEVAVAAPFLSTTLAINGDSSASPVLAPGSTNTATLSWTNTLSVPLTNATVSVRITGAVVPGSIQSTGGFYDSNTGTITFDQSSDPSLASLAPGGTGVGSLSFQTSAGSSARSVTFVVSIAGERVGQSNVPQQVSASATKTASISSAVSLTVQALHSSGPIQNSGAIPPKVGAATTYTVLWRLSDPGNDITNTSVSATLPSYVTYTNKLSPAGASVTYDSGSRTVTWKPGDLASGQTATAAFQVSITPSSSQAESAPTLTSGVSFTGFDRYAQVPLTASAGAVTTETTADPGYNPTNADVQ